MAQRLAVDERHDVIRQSVDFAGGQEWNDVRMLQSGSDRDLATEPSDGHVSGQFGREHLHDDTPAERSLLGYENARHPSAAELTLDCVGVTERCLELVADVRQSNRSRRSR
jgi:hypothetical protein